MNSTAPKKTALYQEHVNAGGKLIDFGGWELPVQYKGVVAEHIACRTQTGLFDVSHMGEFHVEGSDSAKFLDTIATNHVSKLAVGQAQYNILCNANGGIVDDIVIYRRAQDRFLVVVNASNTDKDFKHFETVRDQFRFQDVSLTNESASYSQIAVQGRGAEKIVQRLTATSLSDVRFYWFKEGRILGTIPCIFARTGYTGEDGFELYIPWERGPEVWRAVLEAGAEEGVQPCGLGARDTLRMEMKYPLYGHELSDETDPLSAQLKWVVKMDKGVDFLGKASLIKSIESGGPKKQLVGFKVNGRGIPRQGYTVLNQTGTEPVGTVTSGTLSPSLGFPIGIAYVNENLSKIGTSLMLQVRDNQFPAEVVATPFYKRNY